MEQLFSNTEKFALIMGLAIQPETTYETVQAQVANHPATQNCPDLECLVCSIRDCPQGDVLHYHHDGCPSCS